MIRLGPMSITLLVCALQGVVLAALLLRARRNQAANRSLAALILAVVSLITPYILGYAGAYDRWPQLSFAPFNYTLAFGPLLYLYTVHLIGSPPARTWPHVVPVTMQFLADALVFSSHLWRIVEARTAADGAITVVFDGDARENGRRMLARTVLTRDSERLRITRMTRAPGEPFPMRHAYELRRRVSTAGGAIQR